MYFASSIAENGLTGFSSGTVCVKTARVLKPEEKIEYSRIAPVWFFYVVNLLQVSQDHDSNTKVDAVHVSSRLFCAYVQKKA